MLNLCLYGAYEHCATSKRTVSICIPSEVQYIACRPEILLNPVIFPNSRAEPLTANFHSRQINGAGPNPSTRLEFLFRLSPYFIPIAYATLALI
jgi:hypothetical protein